jgi:hypothetical protein
MKQEEIKEVLLRLEQKVDVFSYSKDSYCLQLLRYGHGEVARIADIKKGPFRGLLEKPSIKGLSARQGDGRMDLAKAAVTGARDLDFRLSYGLWKGVSRWCQVSRLGWQLVLQLNFPKAHDVAYLEKVKPKTAIPFAHRDHPVRTKGLNTLAWVRIDLDPICGEALIEEVQNDWLREADWYLKDTRNYKERRGIRRRIKRTHAEGATLQGLLDYIRTDLPLFRDVWQEALFSACLWLLVEKLGYRRIYMHSWDTGRVLKRCFPPRSLYSRLPKQFCMRRVRFGPGMVLTEPNARHALRTLDDPYWFRHQFQEAGHEYA